MLTARDYLTLREIMFTDSYPGFKKNILESPNGDGYVDEGKLYAHAAYKYFTGPDGYTYPELEKYLKYMHALAEEVAIDLGFPQEFWPCPKASALRVLEYPPGVKSHPHTDYDLFTLNLYRNEQDCLRILGGPTWRYRGIEIHFGELAPITMPKVYNKATSHEVKASPAVQYSIVYFAVPGHSTVLPTGQTVGEWIEERASRSRVGDLVKPRYNEVS